MRRVLIAFVAVTAIWPAAAEAEEVFKVFSGPGSLAPRPTVAVDSRGVGHIAWRDQEAGARYCRVPRSGGTRCNKRIHLSADRALQDRPFVFAVSDAEIVVVGTLEIASGSGSDIAIWRSDDGGNTFAAQAVTNNDGVNESFDDAALGPGPGISLGSHSAYKYVGFGPADARRSATLTTNLTLPSGGAVRQAAVGVAGGVPVVVNWYDEGSQLSFNRFAGDDFHDDADWTTGQLVPGVDTPHPAFLATGSAGLVLIHHTGRGRYSSRLFDGTRFGDPTRVGIYELFPNDAPDQGGHPDADLFAQGGAYHAAWDRIPRSGGTSDIFWSWSHDGRRFSSPLMIAEDFQGEDVQVAASAGFRGLAVWGPGIASVFATRLEPVGGFAGCRPPECELSGGRATRTVRGARLTLNVGFEDCGPPARLRPSLRRAGTRRQIDRVRFTLDSGSERVLTRGPFRADYTLVGGSDDVHRIRAEVTLGRRTVNLERRIRVCVEA